MATFYSPLAIANEFIIRAGDAGVDHMKAQKLVFLTHGFYAAETYLKLMVEDAEVWPYGPVYSSLYSRLKSFRSSPITEPQDTFTNRTPARIFAGEAKEVIDAVWNKYKNVSGTRLSDITHRRGSPWQKIAEKYDYEVPRGTVIPFKMMMEYFRDHAEDLSP